MLQFLHRLHADERGATAIEYGLIVSLIFVTAIAGIVAMGGEVDVLFNTIETEVSTVMTSSN
ncbi:MAG: Flp family type IVb pilin [Pseudomonadota bacterium]